jgi:hypothetical protein
MAAKIKNSPAESLQEQEKQARGAFADAKTCGFPRA